MQWQTKQQFAICPTPDGPETCNVYSELQFPESVYEHINEFYEEKAEDGSR